MQPIWPPEPALSADKREWVDMGCDATYPTRYAIIGRRCSGPDAGNVEVAAMACARVARGDGGSEFVSGFRAKTNTWAFGTGSFSRTIRPAIRWCYTSSRGLVYTTSSSSHRERSMNCPRVLRVIPRAGYLLVASRQRKQASFAPKCNPSSRGGALRT